MRKPAKFPLLIYCEYVKLNIHFTLAAATMLCGLLIFYCLSGSARFPLSCVCNGAQNFYSESAQCCTQNLQCAYRVFSMRGKLLFVYTNCVLFHWNFSREVPSMEAKKSLLQTWVHLKQILCRQKIGLCGV